MTKDLLPEFLRDHYDVHEWRHACAILKKDFPNEWSDIIQVLTDFRLNRRDVIAPGGGKSEISGSLDRAFRARGWSEKKFESKFVVDEEAVEIQSHKIDCYKNGIGLEIEWNSKDQTFDRDLTNFRHLFDIRQLSVGIIVTRADELQQIFDDLGVGGKYGKTTTHIAKLLPRLYGGRGGGCPILVFGIRAKLYVDDVTNGAIPSTAQNSEAL